MSFSNYLPLPSRSNRRKGHGKNGFRRRCLSMAKQQKTRFYILGRCISMLLCWHDHAIRDWFLVCYPTIKVIICLARCQSRMNTEAWPPQSKAAASRSLLGLSAQRRQKHSTWVKQTEGPASPGSLLQAAWFSISLRWMMPQKNQRNSSAGIN